MNKTNGFIWEQLGYESREEWIENGKPTKLPSERGAAIKSSSPTIIIRQTVEADRAWAFIEKHSYKTESIRDEKNNALRVRDQNGKWVCTIDIQKAIIYWNPNRSFESVPGFKDSFPKYIRIS